VNESRVGVLGARSLVGGRLLPHLRDAGWHVVAYTRQTQQRDEIGVSWRVLQFGVTGVLGPQNDATVIPYWICLAPIWVLPDYFSLIQASGARRIVTLSSTSRFTKVNSGDADEAVIVAKLIEGEARVKAWANGHAIEWVVLRPTLIYGLGQDKNIGEIARFICRFGFFPLLGQAQGLRQPIHANDVAAACVAALKASDTANRAYNLSGKETLAYRDMVARVFEALDRPLRLVSVPLWVFRLAVSVLRCLPRYRHWSVAMAERMNRDLVFDHAEATRDLNFKPKGFTLAVEDVQHTMTFPHP
jgi:nucleoside-diphosphate-sugar epimerase